MSLPFQKSKDLLGGIPGPEAGRIASLFTEKRFPRDTVLFYEGAEADALLCIGSGLVKLVALSEKGHETILHILRREDVFGELIVRPGRRPFTAIALTDAVVRSLSRDRLLSLLSQSPAFARNYLGLVSDRLSRVEREFAGFVNAWPHLRLARELIHLAEELGVETPAGTLIDLRLTHDDLSNLIGTTRETVTITLHKFERLGMIAREGRRLVVSRARLAEYAGAVEA